MKLYWIHKYNYPEDLWFCVAESEEDLFKKYNNAFNMHYDYNYFLDNFIFSVMDSIDGYRILLEKK